MFRTRRRLLGWIASKGPTTTACSRPSPAPARRVLTSQNARVQPSNATMSSSPAGAVVALEDAVAAADEVLRGESLAALSKALPEVAAQRQARYAPSRDVCVPRCANSAQGMRARLR